MKKLRWLFIPLFALLLLAGAATASKTTSQVHFVGFGLAQTPGVTCPGSKKCQNPASEPQIRSAPDGIFYAASENGVGTGTEAWRSTDGGRHYVAIASPNQGSSTNDTGFAPGGGDVDIATATAKNSSHTYNVYVASLYLANISVSTSSDHGKTWSLNPTAATFGGADDREWIAADGASKVCISYHDSEQNVEVNCSTDAGATFTQAASAIDTGHAYQIGDNAIGNLAIDPKTHDIFQTYSAITTASEAACAPQAGEGGTCGYHGVYMAVSTDGGSTFTDYPVYVNKKATVDYGHQFTNVSIDKAGNVYSVYTDDHHVYYSFSTTHGKTWKGPYAVTATTYGTQIMPWSTAGDAGKLDVVYYRTHYSKTGVTPDSYPNSAAWTVGFAQNLKALKPGSKWIRYIPTHVIHRGGVCESGAACTGNRDLYDDFGVAANPFTGLASIVYSNDQYSKDLQTTSSCTDKSASNTATCDHTAITTQISGPGIYGRRK
jgi:hypothetical protein